jgi:hypothetical protein
MDIRYFPKQEQEDIDRLMVKLGGKPAPDKPPGRRDLARKRQEPLMYFKPSAGRYRYRLSILSDEAARTRRN